MPGDAELVSRLGELREREKIAEWLAWVRRHHHQRDLVEVGLMQEVADALALLSEKDTAPVCNPERDSVRAVTSQEPIDMVLFCPACGLQHIDEPTADWDNPPHRSHLCADCGHIWRPADVPTCGVVMVTTRGKADSPASVPVRRPATERTLREVLVAVRDWDMMLDCMPDGLATRIRETLAAG